MLRRGPGIARVAVGTAVMAGTAGAVHHHQEQKYANQARSSRLRAAADAGAAAADGGHAGAAGGRRPRLLLPLRRRGLSMDEKMAQLEKLGQLHNSGILTDEEFAAQKAAILNG